MKLRFVEYQGGTYLIIGYAHCTLYSDPECYVGLNVKDIRYVKNLNSMVPSRNIPLNEAIEVQDPERLQVLRILYGN